VRPFRRRRAVMRKSKGVILVTTLSALLYLTFRASGYLAEGSWELVLISLAMFILGVIVAIEGFKALRKKIT
jgi:hypothetical protein